MLKVNVSATSANFGIGFDCLGMAINIENEFIFDKCDSFKYYGFKEEYCNDSNLVKLAYCKVFEESGKDVIPVSISFRGGIPIARGLGSSSSLIVAGVFAANYYLGNIYSKDELFQICAMLEGHPDNVAPAIYGGFTASYLVDGVYKCINYPVNNLYFKVIIPPFEVKTSDARGVLPKYVSYGAAVENISRIIHLPKALNEGNLELLKELLVDKLHEPYRMKLIDGYDEIKKDVIDNGGCLVISGSGSTMLVISDKMIDFNCKYDVIDCMIGNGVICVEV